MNWAHTDDALTEGTAQKWFVKIGFRDTTLEDALRSGQPIEGNSSDIEALIEQDRSLQVRENAETLKIDFVTVQRYLKQFSYVNEGNLANRLSICHFLLNRHEMDPFSIE
ncbi:unnamed protein product [Nezara viridula]|uniref:Uncharacterized protein n=1 Tax=Nezara viridula TaxID=85310 RepID=A0A9P0H8B6_NEZVI|nr:unnamed protein product [Nezara viridula]